VTTREILPNRRQQESFDFVYSDHCFTGAVGLHPDGRIGEVFLSCEKTTSLMESLGRDGAILISLAIQHGCPIETMCGAITRGENDAPATVIGGLLDQLRAVAEARKPDDPPEEQGEPVGDDPAPESGAGGAIVEVAAE